jgi:hypothetical protein
MRSKQMLTAYDIYEQFIKPTALGFDWKSFWLLPAVLRWPESRHTETSVAEALAKAGYCRIHGRDTKGNVTAIWLIKKPSRDEIEDLILGQRKAWVYKHKPSL